MNRERATWAIIVAVSLLVGLLIGRPFSSSLASASTASFRSLFWDSRTLDLAVQVGLMFVGALGVAALLPRASEDNE